MMGFLDREVVFFSFIIDCKLIRAIWLSYFQPLGAPIF